jgi:hypothetical protein
MSRQKGERDVPVYCVSVCSIDSGSVASIAAPMRKRYSGTAAYFDDIQASPRCPGYFAYPALPFEMVDNSSSLRKAPFGRFFVSGQSQQAISFGMRPQPTSSAGTFIVFLATHDTPTASGFGSPQTQVGGKGRESTSRAVHRRCVLPAAMAGVRCR